MTKWRCRYDTRNWPATHSCKALTHSESPQPFDSTNSRQTALVGSKVLCYLLDTIYVPLQLDPCCINKKSVKEVFCCTKNEHDTTRPHICSWPSRVGWFSRQRLQRSGHCWGLPCGQAHASKKAVECSISITERSGGCRPRAGLLHELVELDLRLRPLQSACVPHDLLVGVACAIRLDRGFAIPLRIRDEFGGVSAAQQLFRHAALLPDHERSAFRLPDPRGLLDLGRIDLDVDEADDRHWRPPGLVMITAEKESIDAPEQRRSVEHRLKPQRPTQPLHSITSSARA